MELIKKIYSTGIRVKNMEFYIDEKGSLQYRGKKKGGQTLTLVDSFSIYILQKLIVLQNFT